MTPGSPGPTSAPNLDAVAEDDGRPELGFHTPIDALDPPSVNHAIDASTAASLDLPLQPPLPSSVSDSDVAIAGRSRKESNAEHAGDPPNPSHYEYDMV